MKISLSDLIFQLFLRGQLIALMIHEYGHLIGARALGMYGEIRSTRLNAVYPTVAPPLGLPHLVFYGSGGYFQALVFGLLCLRNKDAENKWINKWIMVEGIIYGAFEALAPRTFWSWGAMIGTLTGFFLLTALVLWKKPEMIP